MARSLRRIGLVFPCLFLLACTVSASSSSSSGGGGGGGGCAGGSWRSPSSGAVSEAPDRGDLSARGPEGAAPTGQAWQPVETDEGCGRSGLRWVLVDEVCGDGTRAADPRSLETPMFRDGALVNGHLFAVDATHLWSIDTSAPETANPTRRALLSGVGQPLAVAARGTDLVMAAGRDGLVIVDATDPTSPTRRASLTLPGSAYDVFLDGAHAFVAMGEHGVAAASLGAGAPTLARTYDVPGLAAGVAVDAENAYVAACSTFAVVDRATGAVRSQIWVPDPLEPRRLAPAKDVALVGSVAFVAAGKLGAVAVDVSDASDPKILGSCRVEDPKFYASGVRAEGNVVFVAGGEWGVLRVDASNPAGACTMSATVPVPPPSPPVECSADAPWEIVDWPTLWEPPPPGKDPIQVLPDGERVFAFGDARRIGVRAVDVRAATSLELTSRYDEPRALLSIAAHGDRLVAAGPAGGSFTVDASGVVTRTEADGDDVLRRASVVDVFADGRWVALEGANVHVEHAGAPVTLPEAPTALLAIGTSELAVAQPTRGLHVLSLSGGPSREVSLPHAPHLPLAIASNGTRLFAASPDWPDSTSVALAGGGTIITRHGVFDEDDARDVGYWRERLPRRYLRSTGAGLVELAAIGPRAAIVRHAVQGRVSVALPPATYAGLATENGRAHAIAIDRGRYKSYVVSTQLDGPSPGVTSVEAFTGAASSIAVVNGRVVVADADGALRVYTPSAGGLTLASTTRTEVP